MKTSIYFDLVLYKEEEDRTILFQTNGVDLCGKARRERKKANSVVSIQSLHKKRR